MRQAGVLAAAAIVALDTMVERLADDHANARSWPRAWRRYRASGSTRTPCPRIWSSSRSPTATRRDLARKINALGVKGGSAARRWRFVTHYGIDSDDVDRALAIIREVFRG